MLRIGKSVFKRVWNVTQHLHSAAAVRVSGKVICANPDSLNCLRESFSQNLKINKMFVNLPPPKLITSIGNPCNSITSEVTEIIKSQNIMLPPAEHRGDEMQMARLIVIRRRKMKKHKLKKLRKKMKFEWAKVRQRREMRKEKAFQAQFISHIKVAEQFSAEHYVMSKLEQANQILIPRFWKGKRLPQFIIKQKLGL